MKSLLLITLSLGLFACGCMCDAGTEKKRVQTVEFPGGSCVGFLTQDKYGPYDYGTTLNCTDGRVYRKITNYIIKK